MSLDLVDQVKGFYNRSGATQSSGRVSRIWPARHLASEFERLSSFSPVVIRDKRTELVILRDENGKPVEYEDTDDTIAMRDVLRDYNQLLAQTFIDIPELDEGLIPLGGGQNLVIERHVHNHGVHRVFNRSDWKKGGRFYGGWWQSCPKAWRKRVFMDDLPTIEDDFSGLHIVMLYGWEGIDYWDAAEPSEDPYRIPVPSFLQSADQCRKYAKQLLLMAVNAETEKDAFAAFRKKRADEGDETGKRLKDVQLKVLLDALKAKHEPIAKYLGAGAGIDLMNQDSRITEDIIKHFIEAGRPILGIHDSYIVSLGDDQRLRAVVQEAFESVTGIHHIKLKREGIGYQEIMDTLKEDETEGQAKLSEAMHQASIHRTPGYQRRREDFYSYNPF